MSCFTNYTHSSGSEVKHWDMFTSKCASNLRSSFVYIVNIVAENRENCQHA